MLGAVGWGRPRTQRCLGMGGGGTSAGARWQPWPCRDRVGADITVLREREVDYDSDTPRKITEVLVRKVPDNQQVSTPLPTSSAVLPRWQVSPRSRLSPWGVSLPHATCRGVRSPTALYHSSWTSVWPSWGMWTQGSRLCWAF